MGAIEIPNFVNAGAIIVPVPVAPFTTPIVQQRGVVSFTRLSAGQYEIELADPLAFNEAIPRVSVPANAPFICGALIVEPGLVRVSCFDAATATPADPPSIGFTVFTVAQDDGTGPELELPPVPVPNAPIAPQYANLKHSTPTVLAALGGAASIPGPGVGFVRFVESVVCFATPPGAVPAIDVTFQPLGWRLGRALLPSVASGILSLWQFAGGVVIGNGESFDFVNSGTGACTFFYVYIDLPATDVTLVRVQVPVAPVDVIPVAPAGFYRKPFVVLDPSLSTLAPASTSIGLRACGSYWNDDTVLHAVETYFGAAVFGRNAGTGANAAGAANYASTLVVTTVPLRLGTRASEPVVTRAPYWIGAYQTYAGVP